MTETSFYCTELKVGIIDFGALAPPVPQPLDYKTSNSLPKAQDTMVERPLTQQSRWLLTNVQTNQQFLNRVNHKVNELVSIKFKITWYNTICIIIIPTYLHWWIEYIIILLGYLNSVVFVTIGVLTKYVTKVSENETIQLHTYV